MALERPKRDREGWLTGADDRQPSTECLVQYTQGLSLDTLARIDEEDSALTRKEGPEQLARKVDVAWRIDQVEQVRVVRCLCVDHRS